VSPQLRGELYANATLREQLYIRVERLIPPEVARLIYRTLLLKHWRGDTFEDDQVPGAASFHSDPITDALLLDLRPKMEEIVGCALLSTYTYARLYFYGNVLTPHRDRHACEVSASISLGCDGGDPAIWFEPNSSVDLRPGDAAVYLGMEAEHWRPVFRGSVMGQLFVHYVSAEGPYTKHDLDCRPERFPPQLTQRS